MNSHGVARLLGEWSSGPGPAHRRLSELLRLLILDGRLPLATTVPGERELAAVLGVSRTTVSTAYATLREQGYLSVRDRARSQTQVPATSGGAATPELAPDAIDFSHAAPRAPGTALHHAFSHALRQLPHHLSRDGYSRSGLDELRVAIADRYTARGVPTTPDQVLVTNGAQHALVLLARTLLRPRDRVVVEHPSYLHALTALRERGCRLVPVAVTEHGWDIDTLSAATEGASLAYLLPDFHNPTGLCMAEPARARLRLRCPVVVDETMAELALDVPAPTPLAAHHPDVITLGSTSKVFWGGLRVGWIRTTPELVQRLAQARRNTDLATPVVEQLACAELLRGIENVLPERVAELRAGRARLRELVAERLPDWELGESVGGLSVWARLPQPISSALAALAPSFGVQVAAGPRFGVGGAFERFVRLPYSLDAESMATGVGRIAEAVAAVRSGQRGSANVIPLA